MKPFIRKDRAGWWIRFKNANGKWVTHKGGDTEEDAWNSLRKEKRRIQLIEEGLVSRQQIEAAKESGRPISDVISEYESYLKSKGCSCKHVKEAKRNIEVIVKGIKASCLAEIEVKPVEKRLADLIERGRSARTRNVYFQRLNAMLNWALDRGMLAANPLAPIDHLNERVDRREISRALTPDEFQRLIAATPNPMRRLYYMFAGRTGLRWQEIKRLRWTDIDLAKGMLLLGADRTKSKRAEVLPIAPDLLAMLREIPKSMGPIFDSTPILRTFKNDVKRAGIVYDNNYGQVDRKSLRKTFGTHLALAGVDLRLTAKLMRHTDPKLTQDVYTDPALLDMKQAVYRLTEKPALRAKEKA